MELDHKMKKEINKKKVIKGKKPAEVNSQSKKKLSKKFKILAAGDLHGDIRQAKKLADKAEKENVDLVILAGDLTEEEESTDYLIGPFLNKKKRVLFIPGNHESFSTADFLAELYKPYAKNLHSYSMKSKDKELGIFGVGGANIGIHGLTEKELFDNLKRSFKDVKDLKKKIMVSHVHPSGTKMEKFSNLVPGSSGIRKAIKEFQPDIAICSHVHEAEGIEEKIGKTRLINVGRQGKIIEI